MQVIDSYLYEKYDWGHIYGEIDWLKPNISNFSNVTKYKFDFYEEWMFSNAKI